MRKRILAVGVAGLCAVMTFGALAQQSMTVHRRFDVHLPKNVTTSDDWLDPGQVVPVGSENNYARMVESPVDIQVGPDLNQNW